MRYTIHREGLTVLGLIMAVCIIAAIVFAQINSPSRLTPWGAFIYAIAALLGIVFVQAVRQEGVTRYALLAPMGVGVAVMLVQVVNTSPVTFGSISFYIIALLFIFQVMKSVIQTEAYTIGGIIATIGVIIAIDSAQSADSLITAAVGAIAQLTSAYQPPPSSLTTPTPSIITSIPTPEPSEIAIARMSTLGTIVVATIGLIGVLATAYATIQSVRIASKKRETSE